MNEKHETERTETEKQLLEYASFAGEIIRRLSLEKKDNSKPKPSWQVFLESTGGAALITVLVGGLIAGVVGQWITNEYQKGMKARETSVAAYKEFLGQGKETVTQAYSIIGSVISASDDLINVSAERVNEIETYTDPETSKLVIEQRKEILSKFTSAASTWREEREKLGLFISYYHDAQPDVIDSWRTMQDSVTAYISCAEHSLLNSLFMPKGRTDNSEVLCRNEKKVLYESMNRFTVARLKAAQQQARAGWITSQQ
ncbi:MAG TPA: hypothetical protein VIP46_22120 [Pyrinomonadaceae bacterium]